MRHIVLVSTLPFNESAFVYLEHCTCSWEVALKNKPHLSPNAYNLLHKDTILWLWNFNILPVILNLKYCWYNCNTDAIFISVTTWRIPVNVEWHIIVYSVRLCLLFFTSSQYQSRKFVGLFVPESTNGDYVFVSCSLVTSHDYRILPSVVHFYGIRIWKHMKMCSFPLVRVIILHLITSAWNNNIRSNKWLHGAE